MHIKVKEDLDKALNFIQVTLEEKFPEDHKEKYKAILTELAKVRHDDTDPKGYKYFVDEVYFLIKAVADFPDEGMDWYNNIGTIGFLLNGRSATYSDIECSRSDEAEDVYRHLVELTGASESEVI